MYAVCAWVDEHLEAVMERLARPPWTLLHGDFRLDNLFFAAGGMWAADFQTVARGRGACDLAYFVTGSADADVDEGALVAAYCDELALLGIQGYARVDCQRDLTLMKLFQIYLHVVTDDILDLSGERGVKLLQAMRDRLYSRIPSPPFDALL